jgi:CMP-N-acetylneuraminic acid synthetase
MHVLAVVPARMGSVRLPRKNELEIEPGLSLVRQAVNCARHSGLVETVSVSGDEIPGASGCLFVRRPAELCGPLADISAAVKHATEQVEQFTKLRYDYVVTLQPAVVARSPLIVRSLISAVIDARAGGGLTLAASHPWFWQVRKDGVAANAWHPGAYPRSQDCARALSEINAVQVARRDVVAAGGRWGLPLVALTLPPWATALDIDTPEDMAMARDLWPWAKPRLETWNGPTQLIRAINP